jgi:tetratricopeptide (TPR) repeat protein
MVHELSGEILLIQGVWNEAEKEFDSAGSIARRIKDPKAMSRILSSQADLGVKRGALDDALEMLRQALGIQINTNDAKGAADSYISMGAIFRQRRDDRRAREVYENVEEMLKIEDNNLLTAARLRLADAFLEIGEIEKAREHALAVHDYTLEVNDMQSPARSRVILGRYYARTKDIELSLIHYNAALDTFSEEANPTSAVETEMLLGQVLVDAGRVSEASEHYLDALAIAQANDFRLFQAEILARLGNMENDRSERVAYLQRSLTVFKDLGALNRMKEIQNSVHRALMGR